MPRWSNIPSHYRKSTQRSGRLPQPEQQRPARPPTRIPLQHPEMSSLAVNERHTVMSIQQMYREASIRGANPVALIVKLYEQLIEDMRHVAIAIDQNNIELRSNRIKHAILVIGHLQSSLDFERGGKVARDLEDFYHA